MHISETLSYPELTVEDFDIGLIPTYTGRITAESRYSIDLGVQARLAYMCVIKAKICVAMGHVLATQYHEHRRPAMHGQTMASDNIASRLVLKGLREDSLELKRQERELDDCFQMMAIDPSPNRTVDEPAQLRVHRALLHMIYYTALSTFHRPQALKPPLDTQRCDSWSTAKSREAVQTAAERITCLATELDDQDLVKYLPLTGITVLLPALATHLLNTNSENLPTRIEAMQEFSRCLGVLNKFKETYVAAEYTGRILEHAVDAMQRQGIRLSPSLDPSLLDINFDQLDIPGDFDGLDQIYNDIFL